ncbi:hypothetical protein NP945_06890 [Mesorhizobium sp. LMG17149]|uniref:hypothetical protein n=1 Tax=unclassified Mesorhizobium TaxID=325217 RepID=UPI000FE976E8|nr:MULTISPECIES: hypothetical protein [unclassified Mesorhizobium]MCQ8871546.1 hypothetical protein [Mesorhizobium sp. LMG17149]RWP05540.1 MAG: hypothetical protein EOQ97_21945 [Mesorhizobium sp.]TIN69455.1 MAG: hypothetical protein E5Y30_19210 [Mesorhizobium sp.]
MEEWKFADPPNVAVFVDRGIVTRGDWIAYVSHDNDDGSWQFHNSETGPVDEGDIMIVSLQNVAQRDESVQALADLPEGWHAWRISRSSPWQRARSHPVPSNDNE